MRIISTSAKGCAPANGLMVSLIVAGLIGSSALAEAPEGAKGETVLITVTVGPDRVGCYGPFKRECYLVDGKLFYDEIRNFDFEAGFNYRIEVRRTQIYEKDNAPADGSLYSFELVRLIAKSPAK